MSNCGLCGGAARVGPVYGSDGAPVATILTDCSTCGGQWTVSIAAAPLLEKQDAATKQRISAMVREQATADPETPLQVNNGLMLHCRQEH